VLTPAPNHDRSPDAPRRPAGRMPPWAMLLLAVMIVVAAIEFVVLMLR
jgi:type VI protein secretion system component VasF